MGTTSSQRMSTGIAGLDAILGGGLIAGRAYLVRGGPGTGKTMLGLHILEEGAARGEKALFISLEEPERQIRHDAAALGLELEGVAFLDLSPNAEFFTEGRVYDIFTPAEVEREPTTRKIIEQIEALTPERVFLDAVTQFRYLCSDEFQFHTEVLSFMRFLRDRGITLVMTSEGSAMAPDDDLQFLSDGVFNLSFTGEDRGLLVTKFRGSDFSGGSHAMRLTANGIRVFPRLVPHRHGREFVGEAVSSGVPELDAMLHGGLERGTVSVITGPAGVGKTTLGLYFMKEAACRGEHSVVFSFEEGLATLLHRAQAVGIPMRSMMDSGRLSVIPIEPLRYCADEFAAMVREEVEKRHARIVMVDSVTGYNLCVRGQDLIRHVHALCNYLRNMGVSGILVNEVETITGVFRATETGISFLSDNIVFLRYMEMNGALHRAIGVLKKRMSSFEGSLREISLTPRGLQVGEPLTGMHGLLSGMPESSGGHGRGAHRG